MRDICKLVITLAFLASAISLERLSSFKELAESHCKSFDVELFWRISSGLVSEKYGEDFFEYDCYIRQFVREDGLALPPEEDDEEEDEEEDSQEEILEESIPEIDPIVEQYAQGLSKCLPEGTDAVKATYAMWRYVRFVVQHDYALEWMRAKVRAGLGYEAERPNAWMDGQNGAERLRLDKLFSNQFYDYVDKLMFKDYLYPIITFLKKNTVLAISGSLTQSGKPILVQALESHNYLPEIFKPVIISINNKPVFSYTIPGIPLLLAGSSGDLAWAFTGTLVDRSNIQEIETVGDKFYNHDTEEWIKLSTQQYEIAGVSEQKCSFTTSPYGTLYTKQSRKGKVQEYIARWHENEKKVRVLFSDLVQLIKNDGNAQMNKRIEFPFNSIVLVNDTGIYQHLCPQFYPSYFLYPDMFGEPEQITNRWITYSNKKYLAVSNTLLTTMKQESYIKGEVLSPQEEQIAINMRKFKQKFTTSNALAFLQDSLSMIPQAKKQKNTLLMIYRKVKFIYIPQTPIRKQCDQIINALQKWDDDLRDDNLAPIFILWNYFTREYTFNHVSVSEFGAALAKHKAISENYWTNQMILWQKGTSYGQCDSEEYDKIKPQVDGTGHNSSCYLNILRGINTTRQILNERYDGKISQISLKDFDKKAVLQLEHGSYKGTHVEEAFCVHFSKNIFFSTEIGNKNIIYHRTYQEEKHETTLDAPAKQQNQPSTDALDEDL